MSSAKAVLFGLLSLRAIAGFLLLLYLLVIFISHSTPLSSALETPLALGGWLTLAVLIVTGRRSILGRSGGPVIISGCLLHLAFVAVAGLTFFFVFTGNASYDCPDQATSCVKLDNLLYLSVIIASHSLPLDSGLGTTMALGGMFTAIVVLFVTALRQFARKGLIAQPPLPWAGFVQSLLSPVSLRQRRERRSRRALG